VRKFIWSPRGGVEGGKKKEKKAIDLCRCTGAQIKQNKLTKVGGNH